jgi:tRNA A37 threonylcarbamoyladenosine modification protein TsaB
VILVIDTSSTMAMVATIDEDGRMSETSRPSRDPALIGDLRSIARLNTITKVAVATGPGSFTGLRKGVSFGLGLAIGLRIPIVPLRTLELQAARSDQPVTAISEAGRGRFYYLVPGGEVALGEPADIPSGHQLVGIVSPGAEAALEEAGHRFNPKSGLRPVGVAAAELLKTAREVPYGSLKLEYMQSFAAPAK